MNQASSTVECGFCHRLQPDRSYIRCFECGHAFRTRLHLWLADWRASWRTAPFGIHWRERWYLRLRPPPRPSVIFSCPCCSHDF